MSNFIKAKGQSTIVNLDKVASIFPSPNKKSPYAHKKTLHKIYFIFESMNNEETLEEVWEFGNKDEYDKVMSFLEGMALEVL